jgi:hypothetical protein
METSVGRVLAVLLSVATAVIAALTAGIPPVMTSACPPTNSQLGRDGRHRYRRAVGDRLLRQETSEAQMNAASDGGTGARQGRSVADHFRWKCRAVCHGQPDSLPGGDGKPSFLLRSAANFR